MANLRAGGGSRGPVLGRGEAGGARWLAGSNQMEGTRRRFHAPCTHGTKLFSMELERISRISRLRLFFQARVHARVACIRTGLGRGCWVYCSYSEYMYGGTAPEHLRGTRDALVAWIGIHGHAAAFLPRDPAAEKRTVYFLKNKSHCIMEPYIA
eukprot:SAG31_NODE_96_length_25743_cov_56.175948_19_plen_154_part_00